MKVFLWIFFLVFGSLETKLLHEDDLEDLFENDMLQSLTQSEHPVLDDVMELAKRSEYLRFSKHTWEDSIDFTRLQYIMCKAGFSVVIKAVRSKFVPMDIIYYFAAKICTLLWISSSEVCHGFLLLHVPILTYIIKNTPEATAQTFCSLLLQGPQDNVTIPPVQDQRFEWTVDLPPKSRALFNFGKNPVKLNYQQSINIALLTDAHIDPNYVVGGVADCDEPTCCRKGQRHAKPLNRPFHKQELKRTVTTKAGTFINLNTAKELRLHRQTMKMESLLKSSTKSATAGFWGDYRYCDTPIWAYENVIQEINKHQDIDLVYYTGDSVDHGVWATTRDLVKNTTGVMINILQRPPLGNADVAMVVGNHDTHPVNQYAPNNVTEINYTSSWIYKYYAKIWKKYLNDDAKTTLRKYGDYAKIVRPGLKVISLNDNVGYRFDWWLVYDPLESKRRLQWIVSELHASEKKGERVHIITHIPPGEADLTHTWTREWAKVVYRFKDTIAAEFNGHTHADEFRLYMRGGEPVGVMSWGGGGATTYDHFNLNYKIVTIDAHTYEVSRIRNYIYNLTEANLTPKQAPNWYMLYDFQKAFQLKDLSANSIYDLLIRMVTTEKHLLDVYVAYYYKMSDEPVKKCNLKCKLEILCQIVVTVLWERDTCEHLKKLYNQ